MLGLFLQAQNANRFFYHLSYKKDSTANAHKSDIYVLDVNYNNIKFYNLEYLKNDSIQNAKGYRQPIFSYPDLSIRVGRLKKQNFYTTYYDLTPSYYSVRTKDFQNWKIINETKIIGTFKCQKAVANFAGRNWTAWFTQDIPYPYGPYKFNGLPGLILEVYDNSNNYHFTFIGNRKVRESDSSRFFETEQGNKPFSVTMDEWKKIQLSYFLNPLKDFEDGLIVEDSNGNKNQVDSRAATKNIQDDIRKNNNPIELDKALKYPVK